MGEQAWWIEAGGAPEMELPVPGEYRPDYWRRCGRNHLAWAELAELAQRKDDARQYRGYAARCFAIASGEIGEQA